MSHIFVYVTCPDADVAAGIARAIVEKRLAACANIFPAGRSFYWWDGAVQDAAETVLIFKTTEAQWPALQDAVKEIHPYEVPCIVALPITEGSAPYLKWIDEQVS